MKLTYKFSDRLSDIRVTYNTVQGNNMPRCHSHPEYELYYLAKGERYLFVKDKFYHITAGSVFLIAPETEHRTLDVKSEPYTLLVLNIPPAHFPGTAQMTEAVHIVTPRPGLSPSIDTEARAIIRDVESGEGTIWGYSAILRMVAYMQSVSSVAENVTVESPTLDRVADILGYIDKHFAEPINLVALSERFYISEFYLCRLFKEYTGRTILSYITTLRIRQSKKLLETTDLPISRIARLCGFGSVSAFGKAFKPAVGMTPREYRGGLGS